MAETLIDNAQETNYSYDPEEYEIDLSLLRLNSLRANSSPPQLQSYGSFNSSSTVTTNTSPMKRPSPESKESDDARRKKLFLPRSEEDDGMQNLMGYSKVPLPMDHFNPKRIRSDPLYKRSLSDSFASTKASKLGLGFGYNRNGAVDQETPPLMSNVSSLPPRPPPMFRRSVSDVLPGPSKTLLGSSATPEADVVNPESSEANKMLYVIKDGVRELDQWCNKLIKYGEAVSSVKKDDSPNKGEDEVQEEQEKEEFKEGVKVDRIGEAFVVEINCPCKRTYRTLFSGRDCYYKLL